MIDSGRTEERDGALWLKTTECEDLGIHDDKNRVMRKVDGTFTYFVPDVAYHLAKFERGFTKAVNIQGSDHHGTIARVRIGPFDNKLEASEVQSQLDNQGIQTTVVR